MPRRTLAGFLVQILTFFRKMKIEKDRSFPTFHLALSFHDLPAIVVAAVGTQPMRALIFAALRALRQRRSLNLPHIVATLVTPCTGVFSLRYRHLQHLLSLME